MTDYQKLYYEHEMSLKQYIDENPEQCLPVPTVIGVVPLPMCYSNVTGKFLPDPFKHYNVSSPAELFVICIFGEGKVNVGL